MANGTWLKVFAFVSLIVLIGGCAQTQYALVQVKVAHSEISTDIKLETWLTDY